MTLASDVPVIETTPRRFARRPGHSLSRIACVAAAMGCSAIALASVTMYSYEAFGRRDALREARQLAATVSDLRQAARRQRQENEAALASLHKQLDEAREAAHPAASPEELALQAALDRVRGDLRAAAGTNTRLSQLVAEQRERLAAIPELQAAIDAGKEREKTLAEARDGLQRQLEVVKGQLLVAAAQSSADAEELSVAPEPVAVRVPETRWALGVSFDNARGFGTLCFDRDSIHETAAGQEGEGLRRTLATRAASAARFRFTHDKARDRVYDAALTVSLAADGPRDRLMENTKLVGLFLQTFAPAFRSPDEWLSNAVRQLAAKDSSERVVLLDTTFKVTAYNDGHGTFTFKVESPRQDLDD
jgi:hypothetical protein